MPALSKLSSYIVLLAALSSSTLFAQPSAQGQWSPVMTWPFKAVHTHMLPTGKVLFWDSFDLGDNARLWDPTTNAFTTLPQSGVNIFCTGHSFLPDGRLLVTGGHIDNFVGLRDTLAFDPFDNTWSRLPDMNAGRWYPTNTTLANGDVLVVSGQVDLSTGMNVLPQVYQMASGTWRDLTSAQLALPFYPFMYVAPNNKIFMAGPDPVTRYLDTTGTGTWTTVATTNYGTRNWGSSVMYDNGKILIVGGTLCSAYGFCNPTATAEIIDLNNATPQWTYVPPMANARKHHNATLLPDGKVLVTGGSRGNEDPNGTVLDPAYSTELWDPATQTWTTLASLTVTRSYHATTTLLPDGRVLSGGGEAGGASAEIFSPPYLFSGARPTITSAPSYIEYGRSFFVATPDAANVTKVTLIALSSVTHSFNETQRISRLTFSGGSGGLNITAPASTNLAPPGYYMLWLLNAAGVPSVAKILRLDGVPATTPAAPTGLTATATGTQINLTWTDNATNETGFKIERSPDGLPTTFAQIATVGAAVTTYTNAGLLADTTYYYRVRATNASGDSIFSNTANATTTVAAPGAPTTLKATAVSTSQINLTWVDNATNETGFRIERSPDGLAATFAQIATVGVNVTTYLNTGLSANTTYYYRVRATNTVGNSAYSNTVNTVTTVTAPAAPATLTATAASNSQINLAWVDNSVNETGFRIERSPDGLAATFVQIATVGANVTTYSNTGLVANTTYYYRVRATNTVGDSAYSNVANTATTVTTPPAPATLTATAISNTQINLAWADNAANETGFKIERSPDGAVGTFTQIATVAANVTSYSNTGLLGGTTYYYRVRANNALGDSAYSNIANAKTTFNVGTQGSAAPTALTATTASTTQINLAWVDNATNETGFKIERSPDGAAATFVQIAAVGANVTTYANTGLSANTTYYYRVRSTNTVGDSAYSNTATAKTSGGQGPAAPTNLITLAISKEDIFLLWGDNSANETGFKIERSKDGVTFTQIAVMNANMIIYRDTDLAAGTAYYYRVRSTNAGGDSVFSNVSRAVTLSANWWEASLPPLSPVGTSFLNQFVADAGSRPLPALPQDRT